MTDDVDLAWQEAMAQPATRGELIEVIQLVQAILLSHGGHAAARMTGDMDRIRETGEKAINHTLVLSELVRDFVHEWTGRDVGK